MQVFIASRPKLFPALKAFSISCMGTFLPETKSTGYLQCDFAEGGIAVSIFVHVNEVHDVHFS